MCRRCIDLLSIKQWKVKGRYISALHSGFNLQSTPIPAGWNLLKPKLNTGIFESLIEIDLDSKDPSFHWVKSQTFHCSRTEDTQRGADVAAHGVKVSSFVPQQYTLLISTISKSNRSACYYLFSDASVIVYIQPAGLAFEERSAAFYLPFIYPSHCLPPVSLHLPV